MSVVLNRDYLLRHCGGLEQLRSKKELRLWGRNIKRIDSNAFQGLTNLETLYLTDNQIEKIDINLFIDLSKLTILSFYNNKIKRLEAHSFKGLDNLEEIRLYDNEIRVIEDNTFSHMYKLKKLSLTKNALNRVEANMFAGLPSLEVLYLCENQIDEIDVSSFRDLSSLKELWLHKNKLKDIDTICFKPLRNIALISLYGNRFEPRLFHESFFKKSLMPSKVNVDYIEHDLAENGGFTSDLKKFLQHFSSLKTGSKETKKEVANNDNIDLRESLLKDDWSLKKASLEKEQRSERERENEQLREELERLKLERRQRDDQETTEDDHTTTVDSFSRYERLELLGSGSYGHVYLVRDKKIKFRDGNVYKAMKVLEKEKSSSTVENELDFLFRISHENIVKYFDHFDHEEKGVDYICIITEYCENGDFKSLISKAKKGHVVLKEAQILDWITQTANGLKYLHKKKIIHRDLKPANMLLTSDNVVKLADLGLAKYLKMSSIGRTYAGTPAYMSPELYRGRKSDDDLEEFETHNFNTDVWSLGCVLYELIHLKYAFPRGQKNNPDIPSFEGSDIFSGVLRKMLEKDPEARISSKKLFAELVQLNEGDDED